ncbi:uncharacterized protein LOC122956798 [Acropora millepora]|uniref:uncharacterized protein LOC122956798 n=1 Tax=Acropora millepora TaxID=45264 RepID=UPI001CF1E0CA|nr:uncharacterized protein LOC122956798 [Acropora millepora]
MPDETNTEHLEALLEEKLRIVLEEKLKAIFEDTLNSILDNKFKEIHLSMSKLTESIEEVKKSASFISSQYDSLLQENKSLKVEVRKTTNELNHLKEEFNNLEQYSRRDCLEIRGVPVQRDEDTNALVVDIGRRMGVEMKKDYISTSHRLPIMNRGCEASSRPPSIIVKFVCRDVTDKFFKAKKQLFRVSSRDLGFSRVAEQKIFIAESLAQRNKKLFADCLKAKYDLNFKYIWTSSGKILLRKNDNSPARLISCDRDLVKLPLRKEFLEKLEFLGIPRNS